MKLKIMTASYLLLLLRLTLLLLLRLAHGLLLHALGQLAPHILEHVTQTLVTRALPLALLLLWKKKGQNV